MSLSELQLLQNRLEEAIYDEKIKLIDSVEQLEEERETNEFLNEIAEDYKKYQNALIEQKQRQQQQLVNILDYLDNLLETQAVTKHTLSHTKNEQKRLVKEIKQLQKDMDNINLD
jgi:hypothetical protein